MSDLLRLDYINSLPQPFMVRLCGDKIMWPIETICVETGLMRIDVCGKLQPVHIGDAMEFLDMDGNSHDPESFYSDHIQEKSI